MEDLGALLFYAALIGGIVWLWQRARSRRTADAQAAKVARAERQRLQECEEVVRFFANNMGYIARQAVSRAELEDAIDDGADAGELVDLIDSSMPAVPGVVLGRHDFIDYDVPVRLPDSLRDRHVYVVGKSGYGKTTLLRNMIYQDMAEFLGLAVIAPEQEMITEEILPFVPDYRIEDVIYLNPADTERQVSFNPLELEEGEDLDLRADETYTILRRIIGDTGPRSDQILRNSIYALMALGGTTLLDFHPLLDRKDDSLRKRLLRECDDEPTVRFFRDIYPHFPADAHYPVLNRIGGIIRAKVVRNCICQPRGSLKFREAIDNCKIVLFNLSDGILGEAASQLLGQLVVAKIQTAAMSRADIPKATRERFYLYVDEFQSFVGVAGVSYEKLFSRARKYGIGLVLAHQQTGQIPLELLRGILGNVSTLVSFQVSDADARRLAGDFINRCDGGIQRVEPEQLVALRLGEGCCRIGENTFFMKTELPHEKPDFARAREVIEASRTRYGVSPVHRSGAAKEKTAEADEKGWPFEDLDPGKVFG